MRIASSLVYAIATKTISRHDDIQGVFNDGGGVVSIYGECIKA